jgi:hypothetical protein
VIEINECVFGPKYSPELLAGDDLSLLLQQGNQQHVRLGLQSDFYAFLPEFPRAKINFENAETNRADR